MELPLCLGSLRGLAVDDCEGQHGNGGCSSLAHKSTPGVASWYGVMSLGGLGNTACSSGMPKAGVIVRPTQH